MSEARREEVSDREALATWAQLLGVSPEPDLVATLETILHTDYGTDELDRDTRQWLADAAARLDGGAEAGSGSSGLAPIPVA